VPTNYFHEHNKAILIGTRRILTAQNSAIYLSFVIDETEHVLKNQDFTSQ